LDENSNWPRTELGYGKNRDGYDLGIKIIMGNPQPSPKIKFLIMDAVQRLNGSG
jgi:hypothetical protein